MERRRVLPDVNVCFPISLLDLVLRLDEAELHRIVWTDDLLDELARVWVDHGARSAVTACRRSKAKREQSDAVRPGER